MTGNKSKVDLIKVDVEGAELFAFDGARNLLSRDSENAPHLIFEFLDPNTRSFGYGAKDLLSLLSDMGYTICDWLCNFGRYEIYPVSGIPVTNNLIASKNVERLTDQLRC